MVGVGISHSAGCQLVEGESLHALRVLLEELLQFFGESVYHVDMLQVEASADDRKVSEVSNRNLGSLLGAKHLDQVLNKLLCDLAVALRKELGVDVDRTVYFAQKLGQFGLSHGLEFFDGGFLDRLENFLRLKLGTSVIFPLKTLPGIILRDAFVF